MHPRNLICKLCGQSFTQEGHGRSRHYCGDDCAAKGAWLLRRERRKSDPDGLARNAIYDAGDELEDEQRFLPGLEDAESRAATAHLAPAPRDWRSKRARRCAYCNHPLTRRSSERHCGPACQEAADLWSDSDCPECGQAWRGNLRCRCGYQFDTSSFAQQEV